MKKSIFSAIAAYILLFQLNISAQSDFVTSGGDAVGSSGSVSYTVGETFYTNSTGETGSISLGVQQPHFVIMIGIDPTNENLSASIYPNPTASDIHLQISEEVDLSAKEIHYQLFDMSGKIVLSGEIQSVVTQVSLQEIADAVYVLRIYKNENEIKSFKIFKSR